MTDNQPPAHTTNPTDQVCVINVVFIASSDDQAIATKKAISNIVNGLPNSSVEMGLKSANALSRRVPGRI